MPLSFFYSVSNFTLPPGGRCWEHFLSVAIRNFGIIKAPGHSDASITSIILLRYLISRSLYRPPPPSRTALPLGSSGNFSISAIHSRLISSIFVCCVSVKLLSDIFNITSLSSISNTLCCISKPAPEISTSNNSFLFASTVGHTNLVGPGESFLHGIPVQYHTPPGSCHPARTEPL